MFGHGSFTKRGGLHVRIAEAFGVTEAAVSQWVRAAATGGIEALRGKSREGQGARLSDEQLRHMMILLERGATSFGFIGELWTCARIAWLIERQFGVRYHAAHVSRLLHQEGWTYQKPILRASQQDEAVLASWLTTGWPITEKLAEIEGRTIVFVDESGFWPAPSVAKTWAPAGKTPVLGAPYTRRHLSVIGGLTMGGNLYTQVHASSIGAHGAVMFLRHVLMVRPEPLLVIWDGAKGHKSRELEEFRRMDTIGRLSIEYFPPYSPEVDPQEYVWHQLKHVELRNLTSFSLDELWVRLQEATRRLRQRAGMLRQLVRHAGLHT